MDLFLKSDAVISPCGLYRYRLSRIWDEALRPVCWIMLNPSTADASVDDPTIRRCVGFAKAWGAGGILVVNLFAYRATDPSAMRDQGVAAVGADNDQHLRAAAVEGWPVVAAWGTHGGFLKRDAAVCALLRSAGLVLQCLGTTKDGAPRHPLYVRGDVKPTPFAA